MRLGAVLSSGSGSSTAATRAVVSARRKRALISSVALRSKRMLQIGGGFILVAQTGEQIFERVRSARQIAIPHRGRHGFERVRGAKGGVHLFAVVRRIGESIETALKFSELLVRFCKIQRTIFLEVGRHEGSVE